MLEIFLNNKWVKVDENIFRSFTGSRAKDGNAYHGKRFVLGTDEECHPRQICSDLCIDCGEETVKNEYLETKAGDILCTFCSEERFKSNNDLLELDYDV